MILCGKFEDWGFPELRDHRVSKKKPLSGLLQFCMMYARARGRGFAGIPARGGAGHPPESSGGAPAGTFPRKNGAAAGASKIAKGGAAGAPRPALFGIEDRRSRFALTQI